MRTLSAAELREGHVAVLGVPWDEHSSFLRGAAEGPAQLRLALASPSSNWAAESGRDLLEDGRLVDAGDAPLGAGTGPREAIAMLVSQVARQGARVIALGGDHAVSFPAVQAHAAVHGPLAILHLDAHPDIYDVFEGDRWSHACPFARILEAGCAARLVQVGIRSMTPHQRAQVARFGVEVIEMRAWRPDLRIVLDGPAYLSLDLDVLDPAYAPGVSHHEPGGMSVRDVIGIVQRLEATLVGADIVELNPRRDVNGVTAMVAAKLVKEIADRLLPAPSLRPGRTAYVEGAPVPGHP